MVRPEGDGTATGSLCQDWNLCRMRTKVCCFKTTIVCVFYCFPFGLHNKVSRSRIKWLFLFVSDQNDNKLHHRHSMLDSPRPVSLTSYHLCIACALQHAMLWVFCAWPRHRKKPKNHPIFLGPIFQLLSASFSCSSIIIQTSVNTILFFPGSGNELASSKIIIAMKNDNTNDFIFHFMLQRDAILTCPTSLIRMRHPSSKLTSFALTITGIILVHWF